MSLTRRIIDLAKSNLNSLLERAAETADPRRRLATIPDSELEAELSRRRAARVAEQKFADNKARIEEGAPRPAAGPMPDRAQRERAAREREERVRAARAARDQAGREADRKRTEQARAEQARRTESRSAPPPSSGNSARGRDPRMAVYYERLEIAYGSDWDTVKTAYRKLMRKYHPDLHGGKSPEKLKAATEVAQALTQAYNELEKTLQGGPNKAR